MQLIIKIASEYVESMGEVFSGYKFGFGQAKEFTSKYYFDFIFLTLDGDTPEEPPVAGGACGFTIDKKTMKIETLSFADLGLLEQNEKEINDVYYKLKDLKENSKSLNWLKSKYQLSSPELLKIKKVLTKTDIQKEQIIDQLNELITKNR